MVVCFSEEMPPSLPGVPHLSPITPTPSDRQQVPLSNGQNFPPLGPMRTKHLTFHWSGPYFQSSHLTVLFGVVEVLSNITNCLQIRVYLSKYCFYVKNGQTCSEVLLLAHVPLSSQTRLVSQCSVSIYPIWTVRRDHSQTNSSWAKWFSTRCSLKLGSIQIQQLPPLDKGKM